MSFCNDAHLAYRLRRIEEWCKRQGHVVHVKPHYLVLAFCSCSSHLSWLITTASPHGLALLSV